MATYDAIMDAYVTHSSTFSSPIMLPGVRPAAVLSNTGNLALIDAEVARIKAHAKRVEETHSGGLMALDEQMARSVPKKAQELIAKSGELSKSEQMVVGVRAFMADLRKNFSFNATNPIALYAQMISHIRVVENNEQIQYRVLEIYMSSFKKTVVKLSEHARVVWDRLTKSSKNPREVIEEDNGRFGTLCAYEYAYYYQLLYLLCTLVIFIRSLNQDEIALYRVSDAYVQYALTKYVMFMQTFTVGPDVLTNDMVDPREYYQFRYNWQNRLARIPGRL